MPGVLLEVSGVVKRFGGFTALDGVDFAVRPGERVGLIGPNGSGKSTLVNCIVERCGTTKAASASRDATSAPIPRTGASASASRAASRYPSPSRA